VKFEREKKLYFFFVKEKTFKVDADPTDISQIEIWSIDFKQEARFGTI
jgi:hypothetical protein